jgi:hypothetical protein
MIIISIVGSYSTARAGEGEGERERERARAKINCLQLLLHVICGYCSSAPKLAGDELSRTHPCELLSLSPELERRAMA